jgi:hypothetical protein
MPSTVENALPEPPTASQSMGFLGIALVAAGVIYLMR